jgi:hypothetical protein
MFDALCIRSIQLSATIVISHNISERTAATRADMAAILLRDIRAMSWPAKAGHPVFNARLMSRGLPNRTFGGYWIARLRG